MLKVRTQLVLVVSLLAAFVACDASAASVAEAMPPDALIYIDIPSVPALRAGDVNTAYRQIMDEPQVRQFLKDGFPSLTTVDQIVTAMTGKPWQQMLDLCRGEVTIAVIPTGSGAGEEAAFVAVVGTKGSADAVREFVAQASARLSANWQDEEIPGATARTTQLGAREYSYAFAGDYFVLSSSLDALKSIAAGLQSGRQANLANDERFVKSLSLARAEQSELLIYVNVARFKESVPAAVALDSSQPDMDTVPGVTSIVYTSRVVGKGYVDKVLVYWPDGRKGIFSSLTPQEGDYQKYMSLIPADVTSSSWMHLDFAELYDGLAAFLSSPPAAMMLSEPSRAFGELEAQAGVRVRDDIVGSFGKNVISYSPRASRLMSLALSSSLGQAVTLVELSDQARMEKSLKGIWNAAMARQKKSTGAGAGAESSDAAVESIESDWARPQRPEPPAGAPEAWFYTEPFGDKTIYSVRLTFNIKGLPVAIAPAVAVNDGWLVFSMQGQSVKNVLGMPPNAGPSILANPDYTGAARIAGPANAGATYLDTQSFFESIYPLVGIALPFVTTSLKVQAPVDAALLPEASVISSHLFGSATSITVQDKTLEVTSFGPVGDTRLLYMAAVGGTALAAWYQTARQPERAEAPGEGEPAKEELTTSELRTLGLALLTYARSHDGAFPSDLAVLSPSGTLKDESGDVTVKLSGYGYAPGLTPKDDSRIIVAFARAAGASGRGVLLVNLNTMNLSDSEVGEQVGGWLDISDHPSPMEAEAACLKNLQALAGSVKRYAETNKGLTPDELNWKTYYRFAPLVTWCPADTKKVGSDYATVPGLNISSVPDDKKAGAVLVYETVPRHGGKAGAAFLDGEVKLLTEEDLKKALEDTRALVSEPAQ